MLSKLTDDQAQAIIEIDSKYGKPGGVYAYIVEPELGQPLEIADSDGRRFTIDPWGNWDCVDTTTD